LPAVAVVAAIALLAPLSYATTLGDGGTAAAQPVVAQQSAPSSSFVRVEGGSFERGNPLHRVTVSGFYMSRFQVTQGEWYDVMGTRPSFFDGTNAMGANWGSSTSASPTLNWRNLPVERVSWFDAVEFANRKSQRAGLTPAYTIAGTGKNRVVSWNRTANGYRLPTEAEWEFAARGGIVCRENFSLSGSNNAWEVAWYSGNSGRRTQPVGTLRPNVLGIHDMSGNVWEWVWDWWGNYTDADKTDPTGASSGFARVIRGGCWADSAEDVRSVHRINSTPSSGSDLGGFRLARPLV